MVDHRADDGTDFSLFTATDGREAWRPESWKDRVTEWMNAVLPRSGRSASSEKTPEDAAEMRESAEGAPVKPAASAAPSEITSSTDKKAAVRRENVARFARHDDAEPEQTQSAAVEPAADTPETAKAEKPTAAAKSAVRARPAAPGGALSWLNENRLPIALTILWVVALGAYGVGYLERLGTGEGGLSSVPTIDLMFFAFSIAGPVGMLWMVVSLMNRTTALSEAMRAQSDSALALAMTVGNLQESVDQLEAGTTGRLEKSLDALETRTVASVVALDDAINDALEETRDTIRSRGSNIDDQLTATSNAISEVLSARVNILDRTLEDASKRLDTAVSDSLTVVNTAVRERSETFEKALDAQRVEFSRRLEDHADALSRNLQSQADALSAKFYDQADEMRRSQGELTQGLQRQAEELSGKVLDQAETMKRSHGELAEGLQRQADELSGKVLDQAETMQRSHGELAEGLQRQADELSGKVLDQAETMKRSHGELAEGLQRQADELSGKVLEQAEQLKTSQGDLTQGLKRQADELSGSIKEQADALTRAQDRLCERVDARVADGTTRLNAALRENLARQDEGLKQATQQYETALQSMSGKMARVLDDRTQAIDTTLKTNEDRLAKAIGGTAATVETDLKDLLDAVRSALQDMQSTLAANPPASSDELADLLGSSAQSFIRPERDALSESVKRLSGLEDQARSLLEQIDRTSRLNPVMGQDGAAAPVIVARDLMASQPPAGVVALPFEALPRSEGRSPLNWTAVVHALDTGTPAIGIRNLVEASKADPEIAALLSLRERVARGLAEDDVHVADLVPEHCEPDLWADFARGTRGGEVTMLAGIDDKVALTLTQARLRSDAVFRETALRFVETYTVMLARAVDEIGADQRLVEIAETMTGRIFMLLAPLTGVLMPAVHVPERDSA